MNKHTRKLHPNIASRIAELRYIIWLSACEEAYLVQMVFN